MRIQHEPIGTFGGITAQAIGNLLNGSNVDLGTFLRETIQNSWDAKNSDTNGNVVRVNLRLAKISDEGKQAILGCLRSDNKLDRDTIENALQYRALIYSDRGTTGLNGPIRIARPGDDAAAGAATSNFVNFVWMLGANDGGDNKGGQFGFGKSVFAGASRVKMYAIHTRVKTNNRFEHRFVICGMRHADQGNPNGRGYTGRFWIGEDGNGDGHSIVALSDQAKTMAGWFGIDSFTGDDTGTTVAIFHPKWQWADERHFLAMARRAVVKWFWPLLSEKEFQFTTGDHTGVTEAKIDGGYAEYERLFALCKKNDEALSDQTPGKMIEGQKLQELMNDETRNIRLVCSQRPFKPLGILGMSSTDSTDARLNDWGQNEPRFEIESDDGGQPQTVEDMPDPKNTLALIRAARMVVSYEPMIDHREGPQRTVFGVFVAASRRMHGRNDWNGSTVNDRMRQFAVEDILAKSEPPRHDEWNPINISPDKARLIAGSDVDDKILANMKTIAKRAVEESKRIFAEWCLPPKPRDRAVFEFVPAGEASQFLSTNVFKTLGNGPGLGPKPINLNDPEVLKIIKKINDAPDTQKNKLIKDLGADWIIDRIKDPNFQTHNNDPEIEKLRKYIGKTKGPKSPRKEGPKLNDLKPSDMKETKDGKIELSFLIDTKSKWNRDEEYVVEAVVSLFDGDGNKSRLKNIASIGETATGAAFADEDSPGHPDEEENKPEEIGRMITAERHGFFKTDTTDQSPFLSDGNSVIMEGGDCYIYKLRTEPGRVLDIRFEVKRPDNTDAAKAKG